MPTRKTTFFTPKSNTYSFEFCIPQKSLVIGVDEAGRGAWAGPVVAACVSWEGKCPFGKKSLNDSKKLSVLHRQRTHAEILKLAEQGKIQYGIGIVENTVIDKVGIKEANRRAMEQALQEILKEKNIKHNGVNRKQGEMPGMAFRVENTEELFGTPPRFAMSERRGPGGVENQKLKTLRLLIDGRDNYSFNIPDFPKPEYIVRGDSLIPQIMAASILAKVTRDSLMREFELKYPGYGFAKHKGYGTAFHQKRLQSLGVCAIHRRSYKPIQAEL